LSPTATGAEARSADLGSATEQEPLIELTPACTTALDSGPKMLTVAESDEQPHVVWLSPSPPAARSAQRVADALMGRAVIAPKDLEVWAPELPADLPHPTIGTALPLDA
jgi:hypothetical protein